MESVIELTVGKLSVNIFVRLFEQLDESTIKCLDKPRRFHVDLLRLVIFLCQIFDFHDVELWHEWINWVAFLVDLPGVFKFSSQMKLLFNFVLILQYSVNPRLTNNEHKSELTILVTADPNLSEPTWNMLVRIVLSNLCLSDSFSKLNSISYSSLSIWIISKSTWTVPSGIGFYLDGFENSTEYLEVRNVSMQTKCEYSVNSESDAYCSIFPTSCSKKTWLM